MESAEQMIERLAQEVKDEAYAAVVTAYESAEHAGIIVGNGHHMAQELAERAALLLRERFRAAQILDRPIDN